MVIFSHRGIGFAKTENSLEAFTQSVKEGFSVEADLRFKNSEIILAHDELSASCDPAEFRGFLNLISDNPDRLFALHIKENSKFLFERIADAVIGLRNCFLFVTDFEQRKFISEMYDRLGKERLGLYVTNKATHPDLINKVEYLWLDETEEDIYTNLNRYFNFNKKIICCSPELFVKDYDAKLKNFNYAVMSDNKIFGICTDFAGPLKSVRCPVCGSAGLFKEMDRVNGYLLLRCNSCFLEFSESMHYNPAYYERMHYSENPSLESVEVLSKEEFLSAASLLASNDSWQPHNHILRWMESNLRKGSCVLDIGCGVGWFIAALESKGFKAIGIEVSTRIVEMLKNKGLSVYLGPFEKLEIDFSAPDLVVLLGVIEHVSDPVGLLKNIRGKFPKSTLLISIPSPKRWDFGIGIRNYWDYPPNHLTPIWSQTSIDIALQKSGYRLKEWFFPDVPADDIWHILLDSVFFKLGLRKKGYFVSLTSAASGGSSLFKASISLLYKEFVKINDILRYMVRPLLRYFANQLKRKGYSAMSSYAIACPD